MTFRVGQKVKYVGPLFPNIYGQIVPAPNAKYTVRAAGFHFEDAILLNEIVNTPRQWGDGIYELWMNAKFFHPIVERKSEISFTEGAPLDSERWDNRRQKENAR
jgi:hypothetical protein